MIVGVCPRGHAFAPLRVLCGACGKPLAPREVRGAGTLLTWTAVEMPPEGLPKGRVGVVKLEAGAMLLARLGPGKEPQIGDRVVVELAPDGYRAHSREGSRK